MRGQVGPKLLRVGVWAAVACLADQLSKRAVEGLIPPGGSLLLIGEAVRFTHLTNAGSAFGLLAGMQILFAAATVGMLVTALAMARRLGSRDGAALAGLGLATGGSAGNLLDRLRYGAVVDFIDVGPWPVFNLADAAIVAGVGLVLWHLARRAPRPGQGSAGPDAGP